MICCATCASVDASDRVTTGTPIDWALHGSVHGWHPERGDYAATIDALIDAGSKFPSPAGPRRDRTRSCQAPAASDAVRALLIRRSDRDSGKAFLITAQEPRRSGEVVSGSALDFATIPWIPVRNIDFRSGSNLIVASPVGSPLNVTRRRGLPSASRRGRGRARTRRRVCSSHITTPTRIRDDRSASCRRSRRCRGAPIADLQSDVDPAERTLSCV